MTTSIYAFECDYGHGRRKHRHRCIACRRILVAGERVYMCRINKGTRVAHIECAKMPWGTSSVTLKEIMNEWATA